MDEFAAVFEDRADPRPGNAQRHERLAILLIAPATLLPRGGTTGAALARFGRAKQDCLREFLPLRHGSPMHRGGGPDASTRSAGCSGCSTRRRSGAALGPSCAAPPRPAREAWWRSSSGGGCWASRSRATARRTGSPPRRRSVLPRIA